MSIKDSNEIMEKHIANIITISRILCSIWMLFGPVFSAGFYGLYLLCGFTDMVDGLVAVSFAARIAVC